MRKNFYNQGDCKHEYLFGYTTCDLCGRLVSDTNLAKENCKHNKTFLTQKGLFCAECGKYLATGTPTKSEEIKKISTKYELTQGNVKIKVKVSDKGLTITDKQGSRNFVFEFSKSETVKAIGKLFIKASEL